LNKTTLVVFGDSNVWGEGLTDTPKQQADFKSVVYAIKDLEQWPYHIRYSFSGVLAQHYNVSILNLAIPGCSNDTIFRRVNETCMGKYPIDLKECYFMIFWTETSRREFMFIQSQNNNKPLKTAYYNYCPAWPSNLQHFPKFNKEYIDNIWHEGHDNSRLLSYQYSLQGLLQSKSIPNWQGYSIVSPQSIEYSNNYIDNIIVHNEYDTIVNLMYHSQVNNDKIYRLACYHPNEEGHILIANQIINILKKDSTDE